ncbi:hypothetical protein EP331_02835 [bacterium]|nr:MAG: hypothetical protein EP331_02835 [bacterium]
MTAFSFPNHSIIHHPSSIIHHPSSIIHHPSSIIHHPSKFIENFYNPKRFYMFELLAYPDELCRAKTIQFNYLD